MNPACIIHTRRPLSRYASGGAAIVAALMVLTLSIWHQQPAVAQVTQVAPVPGGAAPTSTPFDLIQSVPDASTVLSGVDRQAPGVDAPTF